MHNSEIKPEASHWRNKTRFRLAIYFLYFLVCFGLLYLFAFLYRTKPNFRFVDDSIAFAFITFGLSLLLSYFIFPGTLYNKFLPAVAIWILNTCVIFPILLFVILSQVSIFDIPITIYAIFGFFSALFTELYYRQYCLKRT